MIYGVDRNKLCADESEKEIQLISDSIAYCGLIYDVAG